MREGKTEEDFITLVDWFCCPCTVTFDLEASTESPAVISYTKKPKKKGFSLKKVFK